MLAFYGMNGLRVTLTNDGAYSLVISVAGGEVSDVAQIASVLERGHSGSLNIVPTASLADREA